jgi:putative transcriptional regulator
MKNALRRAMTTSLKGNLLIAMPSMEDSLFARSLVFLCAHGPEGAMGLIINKPMPGVNFLELADRLNFTKATADTMVKLETTAVLAGGPVEQHRGFVLHSAEYEGDDTSLAVSSAFKLTATIDILQDMVLGKGPQRYVLALGYSGWSPGQLENEILHNGWLHCDADEDLLFSTDWAMKHTRAMEKLGVDPRMLSREAGHS